MNRKSCEEQSSCRILDVSVLVRVGDSLYSDDIEAYTESVLHGIPWRQSYVQPPARAETEY